MKSVKKIMVAAACGAATLALANPALADLIVNGGFETTTAGNGQLGYNTDATGWSVPAPNGSYAFVFAPGTADTTGANGEYGGLSLWGPGNGSANGLTASPNGGNFVALDSDFQIGALSQTVSGLTAGQTYAVSFYWGGAQQYTFTGPTTDQLLVSLGAQTLDTSVISVASHGFSGWLAATLDFTATGSSETLSFLAEGTPVGVPPFALLDGVSMNAVPETPTLLVSAFILVPVCGHVLRRKMRQQSRA